MPGTAKVTGEFGIEWRRAGTLMIGAPWSSEPGGGTVTLAHRLIVPAALWPEFKELLINLGAILDDAGILDALALVEE